jgi:protein-disulfide isomerase
MQRIPATLALFALFLIAVPAGADEPSAAVRGADVAATVYGKPITAGAVDRTVASRIYALEQQIYALRKSALDHLIVTAVLEHEAQIQGISPAELKRRMTAVTPQVTEEEVDKQYALNAATFSSMSPDEAKERIRLDLESQERLRHYRAAVEKLRAAAPVEVHLVAPRPEASPTAPTRGSKAAPVSVVVFSDFECSYCRAAVPELRKLSAMHGENVSVSYRHYPLDRHPAAFAAARASVCGQEQGKFWEMHDALFDAAEINASEIENAAKQAGVDMTKFRACVAGDASRIAVLNDIEEAGRLGVTSTPTFIVNGNVIRGAAFAELEQAVAGALRGPDTASAEPLNPAQPGKGGHQ